MAGIPELVCPRGLEPLFREEVEPKSTASANFATGTYQFHYSITRLHRPAPFLWWGLEETQVLEAVSPVQGISGKQFFCYQRIFLKIVFIKTLNKR